MIFQGRNGKVYDSIEPAIGRGGEGAVYRIKSMPDYVLKVFRDNKRTETRHRKLLAMLATPMPANVMNQVTWPIDVVYSNGQFAGYIMPAINNQEDLNVMYSDKYNCTLSDRITIAKNLCSAINAVHNVGQVCGDLNPKNISVDPQRAIVTLVDTDSYHITDYSNSKVYRCSVGLPEYLPREIQEKMINGATLETVPVPTFSKYTDLFALAVHIFVLLMNGCHPFACAINNNVNIGSLASNQVSVIAPQPIENICTGFFPFYDSRQGVTTPQYAPEFSVLPHEIQNLFIKSFVEGHNNPSKRPDAVEWYNALSKMQGNLKQCNKNRQHMYSAHLQYCPWCKIENRMKSTTAQRLTQSSINTYQYYRSNKISGHNANINSTMNSSNISTSSVHKMSVGKWTALIIGVVTLIYVFSSCANRGRNSEASDNYGTEQSVIVLEQIDSDTDARDRDYENEEQIVSPYTVIDVPALSSNEVSIEKIAQNAISIENADIATYSGSISYEDQVDEYSFVAPYNGRYRVDISRLWNETNVELYIYDEIGEAIGYDTYCVNEDGVTVNHLLAGHTYKIVVRQRSGFSDYILSIGMQKASNDITGYTALNDSVEYEDQRNVYWFTVPLDGRYRFEVSGMISGTVVELFMFNDLGEDVAYDTYCVNGDGITVKRLETGEVYEIQVVQHSGFSSYTLNTGYQKETIDISDVSLLNDSVEYTDQRNVYSYTVPLDGQYRFEVSGMISGTVVELYMFNDLGETVASDTYCTNGEGITVSNLKSGEIYELQVRQASEFSDYTFAVGRQKESVEVTRNCIVNDSIEYTDQRNVYSFTAKTGEDLSITIERMNSDMDVELYVFNDLGETITSDTYCTNGEGVILTNVSAGTYYEIQVLQNNGLGAYSLNIE